MNTLQRVALLIGATAMLSACSKTVQWEEEVLLNTGEVIWVKRTDNFERAFDNNPFKPTWSLKERELRFSWQRTAYAFQTETAAVMMIYAFHDTNTISVVAWEKECATRGYGESRWLGGKWQLQKTVSPLLIGQPRNVMSYFSAIDGEIPDRVTQDFIRNSHFELPQKGGAESHLMSTRISSNCTRSK